jgi:hypothetical protein
MLDFKNIFENWMSLSESNDKDYQPIRSLRVLDFDHTVAFTGEMVYIMSPEGEVVDTLDSEEYSHHSFSRDEILAGYYYDFREFDDVDASRARENQHVTSILRNFINAAPGRIILILTARNQEAEGGIRNYLETIGIDHGNISVIGVGSSAPQKKVDRVREILDQHKSIEEISFFDDSGANTDEMMRFLKTYEREDGSPVFFDIAKVESDGKLTRMPGYRARRRNA